MKQKIVVSFCVAYDWELLAYSLPPIYQIADQICLSIDKDRISWAGNPFSWDQEGFMSLIERIDTDKKIVLFEDDFHLPDLLPMQNEVRQRNEIARFVGDEAWHIQLDTDEFFLNFEGFVNFLHTVRSKRRVNIACPWITLYKSDADGFFYVKPKNFKQIEFIQVATRHPNYEYGRRNGYFNIRSPFALLHLSWARSESEIWEKLNNWGHKDDIDVEEEFKKWKDLSLDNYQTYTNFHHVIPEVWPQLGFIKAKSIEELLSVAGEQLKLPITKTKLQLENSIWVSRAKKYIRFKK